MILKVDQRIHMLREQSGMTQQDLALRLGVTRSSVNSWEMGISTPTTEKIAEMALLFKTSADYILGISSEKALKLNDFTMDQQELVYRLIQYFDKTSDNPPKVEKKKRLWEKPLLIEPPALPMVLLLSALAGRVRLRL